MNDYTAAPVYFGDESKGAHEWLIEFEEKPACIKQFAYELDCALKSLNSDYEAKRYKDMALTMPQLHIMEKGIFHEWLKSKGKLGGQHKVPRLSNDRKYIDDIKLLMLQYQ